MQRSPISRPLPRLAALLLAGLLYGCTGSTTDYMADGKTYLERGEHSAALISFKNAVQQTPDAVEARLALADALELTGDLPAAEQHYRRALALGADADELVPRIALLLLDRSENTQLIRDFAERKLSSPAADSNLRALVALAHMALGQTRQASAQLAAATDTTAAVTLARAQEKLLEKRPAEAASMLAGVVDGGDAPWWVLRAASRAFRASSDSAQAIDALAKAYERAPFHHGVIGEYAEALIGDNRRDEAWPLRSKLLKLAPSHYRTQYLNTLYFLERRQTEQAHAAATRVLASLPEHLPSQLIAASIDLERNDLGLAESRIDKALKTSPGSVEALRLRAALDIRKGDLAAASRAVDRALSLAPGNRTVLSMAAELAWANGDRNAALGHLLAATRQEPVQADLLANLAQYYFMLGRPQEADQALQRAIELSTNEREREATFNAALRLGRLDTARQLADAEIAKRPNEAAPRMWLAAVSGSTGDQTGALRLTHEALDRQADFYPALRALQQTGNTPELRARYLERLQRAVDSGSKNPAVYLDRIQQLSAEGASPETIGQAFERALATVGSAPRIRRAAVGHWLAAGDTKKALAIAKEGEAMLPDDPEFTALAASVQLRAHERADALAKFARLTTNSPERLDWSAAYASALVEDGRHADAVRTLRRTIGSRPDDPVAYQTLAHMQFDAGHDEDARVTAQLLRDRPDMAKAGLILLGDLHARAGRVQEALKTYTAAADAGAIDMAWQRKVDFLLSREDIAQAGEEADKWRRRAPNSVAALGASAKVASQQGNHAAAARHLAVIVDQDPENPIALNDYAWALVMANDPKALEWATKAAALAPGDANILDTLSQAQAGAGHIAEAIDTLSQAHRLAPGNPFVKLHLAELLVETGRQNEAPPLLAAIDASRLDREARLRLHALSERFGQ